MRSSGRDNFQGGVSRWASKTGKNICYLESKLTWVIGTRFDQKHRYSPLKINLRPQKGNLKILKISVFQKFQKVQKWPK